MKLGCLSQIAVVAVAIAAGVYSLSFWWTLIPAFLAGSFQLSNGPGYDLVIRANREGRLGTFPMLLLVNITPWVLIAGIVFWITTRIA